MAATVLIATDHPAAQPTVRAHGSHAVLGLSAGDAPVNSKQDPNEDSVAAVDVPGGVALVVADSHYGAAAGERAVHHVVALLESLPPADLPALKELVLAADDRCARMARDSSETTLLVAVVRGRQVEFVSVADSLLFVVAPGRAARLTTGMSLFCGGSFPLRAVLNHPVMGKVAPWEHGSLTLEPGEMLLLASDGLEPPMSGLMPADLPDLLLGEGALEARVGRLVERVRSKAAGGGRDNIGVAVYQVR